MSEIKKIRQFQEKFDLGASDVIRHLSPRVLQRRIAFLQEELNELRAAADCDSDEVDFQDMAEIADALVDLVYVAKGTAVMMGLPWRELFDDVHRANMGKVRGATKRGHQADCMKPEDWVGPRTAEILTARGYNPNDIGVPYDSE